MSREVLEIQVDLACLLGLVCPLVGVTGVDNVVVDPVPTIDGFMPMDPHLGFALRPPTLPPPSIPAPLNILTSSPNGNANMTLELTNTYHQYKQDTKQFLCWLASTAAGHGWAPSRQTQDAAVNLEQTGTTPTATEPPPPLVADNVQDAPKPRSRKKKKNVASACASAPVPSTSTANPTPTTHAVALRDFIPMAELIASKSRSSTRKLPSSISQVLDRVIRLREAFAVLLDHSAPSPAGTTADPESDKTHHHFVNILK